MSGLERVALGVAVLGYLMSYSGVAYNLQVWSAAEAFVLIVCGCIPTLMPLWDRVVTHKPNASYNRTPTKYAGGNGSPGEASWPGSDPYSRLGQTGVAKSTFTRSGSEAEIELMPPPPDKIRVISSYSVHHNPGELV